MTNAVVTAGLQSQNFPTGTIAGPVAFDLIDLNSSNVVANQSVPAGQADTSSSATFANVGPGTYFVRISRQDSGGNVIGTPAKTESFTVAGPSVTITVPVSGSVSVQ